MKLVIISGLSGSGKSVALNTLEDLEYYCIDNLPVGMLSGMADQIQGAWGQQHQHIAVGIDARNHPEELQQFPALVDNYQAHDILCEIIFLQADDNTLLKRFSETRRKHPLSDKHTSLADAIKLERRLLEPIASRADLFIDTTHTTIYQLRDLIRDRLCNAEQQTMSLLFQSFGYKHGIPADADYVFDVRCLPNPHWETHLRPLTGRDEDVVNYLEGHASVRQMRDQLISFLEEWVPRFENENRSYLNVSIGCTGGQHRSVYMVETLGRYFRKSREGTLIKHRELS